MPSTFNVALDVTRERSECRVALSPADQAGLDTEYEVLTYGRAAAQDYVDEHLESSEPAKQDLAEALSDCLAEMPAQDFTWEIGVFLGLVALVVAAGIAGLLYAAKRKPPSW